MVKMKALNEPLIIVLPIYDKVKTCLIFTGDTAGFGVKLAVPGHFFKKNNVINLKSTGGSGGSTPDLKAGGLGFDS